MSFIDRRVNSARRRLWTNRYLHCLSRSLLWAGAAWLAVVLVKRILGVDIPLHHAAWIVAAGAFLTALMWLILSAEDRLTAAIALDKAGAVKERLSTALYLRTSTDPFAQAAVADAEQTASTIHVRSVLPVRYPRLAGHAATTWLLAMLLVWLLPSWDVLGNMQADQQKQEQIKKVEAVAKEVKPKIDQARQQLKEKGLLTEEMKKKLDAMETKVAEMVKTPDKMTVEPIKPMTALSEQIKQEQKNLQNQLDGMQAALNNLSSAPMDKQSPANQLTKDLASGDMQKAAESLEKLREQIEQSANDPARAEQIAQEMAKLAEALQNQSLSSGLCSELRAAGLSQAQIDQINQAMQQGQPLTEQDVAALRQAMLAQGLSDSQIAESLAKLQAAVAGAQMANNLGQSLAQACQAMKQGQQGQQGQQSQSNAQACKSPSSNSSSQPCQSSCQSCMSNAGQQLSQMQALQSQAQQMQALLAGMQSAQSAMGQSNQSNSSGQGAGIGRGRQQQGMLGPPPPPAAMAPTQIKGMWKNGRMVGEYFDHNRQVKGESRKELTDVVTAAQQEAAKTIDEHKLPPQYDRAVQGYFSELRQLGQPTKPAPRSDD